MRFLRLDWFLKRRISVLRGKLDKIKKSRDLMRKHRRDTLRIPTVAVVGYTNSGKTSLIKALTTEAGGDGLVPKDKLFATLDVTVHQGFFPK